MAVELGTAYLSIGASTDGFSKDVKKALGGAESSISSVGKRGGSAIAKGLGAGLKIAGGAAVGLAATLGGIALKGGFSRALNIEDATAKLQGLGHDTKSVQTIMDSALASVKGTAFGLGDAASVAASTVAAGVKPGEDLTRTLKLVADASTIAGTSMGDMGAIFNKVAGTGKIQGEVIAQLGERGIPILQLLAEEMGVSAGEVAKMASKGEIDFERFQNAMEAGMGGAALKSGETFRGALANVGAALGRLGEKFAKPTLDALRGVFNDAIPAIDALTDKIAPFAEKFGKWMGGAVERASAGIPRLIEGIKGVWSILRSGDFQGAAATFGLEEDSPIVGLLFGLREKFLELWEVGRGLFDALAPTFERLVPIVSDLASNFSPLSVILRAIEPIIPILADSMARVGQVMGGVLADVIPHLSTAVDTLAAGLADVVTALLPLVPALVGLLPALAPLLPPFIKLVTTILPPLVDLLVAVVEPIVDLLVPALTWLADVLTRYGVPALEKWWGVLGAVVAGAITGVKNFVGWIVWWWREVVERFNFVRDHIAEFPDAVKKLFENAGQWLYNAGKNIVDGLLGGLKNAWDSVTGWISDAASGIGNTFKSILGIHSPSTVFEGYGKDIVAGLVKGIRSKSGDAGKASADLAKMARDAFGRGDRITGGRLTGLAGQAKMLDQIRRRIEAQNSALKEQRQRLRDLKSERAQMREQVGSSIRGELDLASAIGAPTTDAYGRQSAGKTTFASVAGVVKAMAARAKKFAERLKSLAKAGIPAGLIQEVAGLGSEQGIAVADALLSGSVGQIKELAADFSALEHWSDQAGKVVAAATFDTAIAAQQGLIEGLEADNAALEKAAKRLAKRLAKAIKQELKIKSPSRVFRDEVGVMLTRGIIDGIDDGQRALDARVASMVPRANVPTPHGMDGNSARRLTDADVEALAGVLARTPITARAYLDDREARKVTQAGIQGIRRTDPAILTGGR